MPKKANQICTYVVCNTIVQGKSRCDKHEQKSWDIKRTYDPFYSSKEWKRLSKAFREANPLCEECLKKGRTVIGKHRDHIKPIADGGAPLEWNNIMNLCIPCHSSKTAKEIRNK